MFWACANIPLGPFDLAKQIGVVRGGDEHKAAIERILKAAKAAGKKAAIFCTDGNQAREYAEQGFDMVSVITDQGAMGNAMVQSLSAAQGRNAGNTSRGGY